ncbi:unnamed protein product [Miscanthus lutarioriparius]|uniref:Phosphoribosylformimino-5-aminoimidazole carboxamide ribotide isomerase n=1 Tax=Miscanthus lutarioriparius TaxID=422564 RepID=A0A811MG96_9POAL|nr:unnamed protein product [Miscanthus lutarioriparius]
MASKCATWVPSPRRGLGKVKQIVGSTLRDSSNDGMELVTNFESDKSPAEFTKLYKEDELLGGHVIMLGADPASQAAALEALHAYPGENLLSSCCKNCDCSLGVMGHQLGAQGPQDQLEGFDQLEIGLD